MAVIEDKELTDIPGMIGREVPEAILLNSNDHGYGVFLMDDKSIRYFEENLSTIENKLNQACVTSQLIMMMKQVIYPATRLPILLG